MPKLPKKKYVDKLYNIHRYLKRRCEQILNEEYKKNQMAGIGLYPAWSVNFNSFYNWALESGYRPGKVLYRKDLKEDWCPTNCAWRRVRPRKRMACAHMKVHGMKLKAYCERFNLNYSTVVSRIKGGWTILDAVTLPVKQKKKAVSK